MLAAAWLLFFALPLCADAARQETVELKGMVLDKATGKGLGWATVVLRLKDGAPAGGVSCDENGQFSISAKPGEYILTGSLIGYRDTQSRISLDKDCSNAPVRILLEEDSSMLASAKVTGKVRLIEMKADKLVMNVSQSAFAQGSDALEILKKAPGVIVDQNGNVKLNGKSVQIWIDGRPSNMSGSNLEALLRSTGGDGIEKLEIMEYPSAKYDAEGQGGIINIRTKRNRLKGFNGNVGIDGGGMYFSEGPENWTVKERAWANFNYRGKVSSSFLSLNQGLYSQPMLLSTNSEIILPGSTYSTVTESIQKEAGRSWQARFGSDFFIDSKNTIGFIIGAPWSKGGISSGRAENFTTHSVNGVETERTESDTYNDLLFRQVNANLNYTHVFDESRGAELTANLDWYRNDNPTENGQYIYAATRGSGDYDLSTRFISAKDIRSIYSAKVDYQTAVKGFAMLEAGAKWALSATDNDTRRTGTTASSFENNNITKFNYREHIAAAYASFSAQIGPKWSLKAGLRGEYTNSRGDWISNGEITGRELFDIFPTAYVGFTPNEKLRLSVAYVRRIDRPSYNTLNPTETYLDAHSLMVGNPDLKPSYVDQVSLSAGFGQYISVSALYSHSGDLITQQPLIKKNGNQLLKWVNFGCQDMGALALSISELPVFKWLSWTLNANGLYMNAVTAEISHNESYSLSAYSCLTFNLPADWKIQLDGNYLSPMAYSYFKTRAQYILNLGIRKPLLDGKMILTVKMDDMLRSSSGDLDCVSISGDGSGTASTMFIGQKYRSQCLHVGLSWNFGKSQRSRARNVGTIDEASRLENSSAIGNN